MEIIQTCESYVVISYKHIVWIISYFVIAYKHVNHFYMLWYHTCKHVNNFHACFAPRGRLCFGFGSRLDRKNKTWGWFLRVPLIFVWRMSSYFHVFLLFLTHLHVRSSIDSGRTRRLAWSGGTMCTGLRRPGWWWTLKTGLLIDDIWNQIRKNNTI